MTWQTRKLWEKFRFSATIQPSYEVLTSQKSKSTPKEPVELDPFDKARVELEGKVRRPKSQDEFDNYLTEVHHDLDIKDPLKWWLDIAQTKRWPVLSRFALNILCIPPMSDSPERVFSGARRTIGWERIQLSPEQVETCECEKDWIRSGILSTSF